MAQTVHRVKASTQYKREHKADYGKEKIKILYQDKDIVVIVKPTGLLSVPYPGSKVRTAIELLEKIMRNNGSWSSSHRPFVVHRLDRDTSGVLMFARSEAVQKKVMDSWHTMVKERLYHAVAENPRNPKNALSDEGLIDDELAQNAFHVGYVPKKGEKNVKTVCARTHYKILYRGKTHSLFELELDTGKKNQIRAHLSSKGYPLAGDENYRAHTDPFHRLALHARTLAFVHPVTGEFMRFEDAEDEYWLEYVKKGDEHPATPIWETERKAYRQEKSKSGEAKEDKEPKIISSKKLRSMDFIERGKNFRG